MKTIETTIATLKTADYYINYYGQTLDIKPMTKIFALFTNGGGYGGGSHYYGESNYDLYKTVKPLYDTMVKVGTATTWYDGGKLSCRIILDGQEHVTMDVSIDNIMSIIFKRENA
jgi:hypothetical protein